jgi:hypothetical protein
VEGQPLPKAQIVERALEQHGVVANLWSMIRHGYAPGVELPGQLRQIEVVSCHFSPALRLNAEIDARAKAFVA